MGMRRNIALTYEQFGKEEQSTFYLYTHWGAEGLKTTLKNALEREKSRWNDPSYLARIIFSEMTRGSEEELTGFGIALYEIDPQYKAIQVNLDKKTVDGIPFEEFVKGDYRDEKLESGY